MSPNGRTRNSCLLFFFFFFAGVFVLREAAAFGRGGWRVVGYRNEIRPPNDDRIKQLAPGRKRSR